MCGLAGVLLKHGADAAAIAADAVARMCERMRTRGPDAAGEWRDPEIALVLGHRRLSILDPEPRANQPMHSDDGRYVIVFNGEIYNFRELRSQLQRDGVPLHTRSDTEVLLALFARSGERMLTQLRGMFALAIWDRELKRVFLARDPYGIKPLYVARSDAGWLFASQVKALLASNLVAREPDPIGQAGFWLLGSVPEPHTWFRDIQALPAGHWSWLDANGLAPPRQYQDLGAIWREAPASEMEDAQVQALVRQALHDSIDAHLVSDVPVGVFLSGGIDSGSLAALMTESGADHLKGITVAFAEFAGSRDDEAPVAAQLAARYGIEHHVRRVDRGEFERDLPAILDAMDQPSIDGINTWFASKAVAELGLKVVVSGVGGDELFQGYASFHELPRLLAWARAVARIPGGNAVASALAGVQARRSGNPRWQLLPALAETLPGAWFLRRGVFAPDELPALMGTELAAQLGTAVSPQALVQSMTGVLAAEPRLAVGQIESMTYLRNQLLRDSDWASMAHSVELRTPLVDAWLLRDLQPVMGGLRRFPGKQLLAQAPAMPLPEAIATRSKTGFGIPVQAWLASRTQASGGTPLRHPLARLVARECYR
jgi:asparagine synthase (glutamine-hydrolysing)